LKAILFHDALNAASADGKAGLAHLLSDDVDRGVRIEEAVTNDLALDLLGPDKVGLGPTFLILEGEDAMLLELREHLIITLSRKAKLCSGFGTAEPFAFPLQEHEQSWGKLVD
jgi:hypothetical protein